MQTTADVTRLEQLTQINTEDILGAFGVNDLHAGRGLLAALCRWPARRFARQVLAFDQQVGRMGLGVAGLELLLDFRGELEVVGLNHIPTKGATLVVANHPGLSDTIALFAAIFRRDIRIIAADRPFLRALPNTSQYLICLDENAHHNLAAVRTALGHLRRGGVVLTFPGGEIEPDPAIMPGAAAALENWSASVTLFTRLTPAVQVIPALVSGVLSPRAQRNPLRYLRRTQKDREWLAAMLQILIPAYQPVQVRVDFGTPIRVEEQNAQSAATLMADVRAAMQQLITQLERKEDKGAKP